LSSPCRQGKLAVAHVAPVVSVDAAVVAVWLWLYTGFPGPSKACLQDAFYFSWHDAKPTCFIATVHKMWQDKHVCNLTVPKNLLGGNIMLLFSHMLHTHVLNLNTKQAVLPSVMTLPLLLRSIDNARSISGGLHAVPVVMDLPGSSCCRKVMAASKVATWSWKDLSKASQLSTPVSVQNFGPVTGTTALGT